MAAPHTSNRDRVQMQTTYLIASDEDLNRQLRFVFGFCCCHGCRLLGLGLPLLLLLGLGNASLGPVQGPVLLGITRMFPAGKRLTLGLVLFTHL